MELRKSTLQTVINDENIQSLTASENLALLLDKLKLNDIYEDYNDSQLSELNNRFDKLTYNAKLSTEQQQKLEAAK